MIDFDYPNLKMSLILTISIFMSNLNFILRCVEYEKMFLTLGPGIFMIFAKVFVPENLLHLNDE